MFFYVNMEYGDCLEQNKLRIFKENVKLYILKSSLF